MTPGAPPSTPDPRRFLPSRRAVAGSQQETPGPRQFQPSGGFAGSSSQRFQATPRFAPHSSAHNSTTPRPTPSTQVFLLPGSVRSTQRREREQIDDVPSSSPAGFTSPVPANKGTAVARGSIEVDSEIDGLEESQSVIADSAGEYEGDGDGDEPAPKRRRTRPLLEPLEDGQEKTMVYHAQEHDLMDPEQLDGGLVMSDLDDEMGLSDHERRGNPEQQPRFHAAPRFKLPETEEAPADGLPEAFSPQRRGAKYIHGGMAAEMQSWLADVRGWTGHDKPPDAVMRVVIDEVRPGNTMYLVRGRRLLRDEAVADPGAATLRIMLAGEGKSTGLTRRATVGVGTVVIVSQPVWEVPLKGDGRWIVVCEWAVDAE